MPEPHSGPTARNRSHLLSNVQTDRPLPRRPGFALQHLSAMEVTRQAQSTRQLVVTSTGFSSAEKVGWVQRLCQALGASYQPHLEANACSYLVCRSMVNAVNTPKYTSALRWGIKVVSWEWLEASAAAKQPQPASRYKDDPSHPFPFTAPGKPARQAPPATANPKPRATAPAPSRPQPPPPQQPRPTTTPPPGHSAPDFTFASVPSVPAAARTHQDPSPPQRTPDMWHLAPPHSRAQHQATPLAMEVKDSTPPHPPPVSGMSSGAFVEPPSSHTGDEDTDMDVVIPGTQMVDEDDDPTQTTPESLTTFLAARRAALGAPGSMGTSQPQPPTSSHGRPTSHPAAAAGPVVAADRTPGTSTAPSTTDPHLAVATPASVSVSALNGSPSDNFSVASASPCDAGEPEHDSPMLVSPAPRTRQGRDDRPPSPTVQLAGLGISGLTPVTSQQTLSPASTPASSDEGVPAEDEMLISPAPQPRSSSHGGGVLYSGFGANLGATPVQLATASGPQPGTSQPAAATTSAVQSSAGGGKGAVGPAAEGSGKQPLAVEAAQVRIKVEPEMDFSHLEDDVECDEQQGAAAEGDRAGCGGPVHRARKVQGVGGSEGAEQGSDVAACSDQQAPRAPAPALSLRKLLSAGATGDRQGNSAGSSGELARPGLQADGQAIPRPPPPVPVKTESDTGMIPGAAVQRVRGPGSTGTAAGGTDGSAAVQVLHGQLLPQLLTRLEQQEGCFLERPVQVVVLKELARMPRASTFKIAHAVQSSSQAKFCEQLELQVCAEYPGVVLSAKDKAKNVSLPVLRRTVDTAGQQIEEGSPEAWAVAEPVTFYCLKQDGSWWMEYHELMSVAEAQRRATADHGVQCVMPAGVLGDRDLLKDVCCRHARLSEVVGCVRVSRSSKIKPSPLDSSLRALGDLGCAELMQLMASMQLNQRYEFDGTTGEVLTKTDTTRALVLDP